MLLYKVIKPSIHVGDKTFSFGETFNPAEVDDTLDWSFLTRLKQIEVVNNPAELAAEVEKKDTPEDDFTPKDMKLVPKITKSYGWYTVTVNGEEIGTKTRDKSEAQRTADEWSSRSTD